MSSLTHARLLRLFDYESATGNLIWKVSESNRIKVGATAGAVARNGRRYIGVDGERQLAHRLVWFWHKGEWPSENLTPANGDYLDTRVENLVEQTAQETVTKGRLRSTNTSGVKGIWFDKGRSKWAVQTVRSYRTISYGRFDTLEEAQRVLAAAQSTEKVEIDVERQQLKRMNSQQRRMWNRMLRACQGKHVWSSIDDFVADVGASPAPNFYIAPRDATKPVGPDNFVWSAPKHDASTAKGRNISQQIWRAENLDKRRNKELQRTFGITLADYNALLEEQGGVCAICSQPETAIRKGRVLPLAVDHNHRTGAVRGLLCSACNIGIGSLAESKERLLKAIAYLDKWDAIENQPLPDNVVQLKKD